MSIGCVPVGPCSTVAAALGAVREQDFDIALLDVNLSGERVYPVATALRERHIPFLFLTGYGEKAIPAEHPDCKVCAKPFKADDLSALLASLIDNPPITLTPRRW